MRPSTVTSPVSSQNLPAKTIVSFAGTLLVGLSTAVLGWHSRLHAGADQRPDPLAPMIQRQAFELPKDGEVAPASGDIKREALVFPEVLAAGQDLGTAKTGRRDADAADLADEGKSGAFVLHVTSAARRADADASAKRLRHSGHHAFVEASAEEHAAKFRVRIGPFASMAEATRYQKQLEQNDGLFSYVIRNTPGAQH